MAHETTCIARSVLASAAILRLIKNLIVPTRPTETPRASPAGSRIRNGPGGARNKGPLELVFVLVALRARWPSCDVRLTFVERGN